MYVCDNTVFMNSHCFQDLELLRPSVAHSQVHEILKTINSKLAHRQCVYWEVCWSITGTDTLLIFQKVNVCEEGGME